MTFENGLKGMVQDIQKDTIGCILFGSDVEIKEGTKVMRTKKESRSTGWRLNLSDVS